MFSHITLRRQFHAVFAIAIVAFIALFAITVATLSRLQVGGPLYAAIVSDKDLIADALPPPAYIIEAYAVAQEIGGGVSRQ